MIPQIPKFRRDITLEGEWTETGSGAPFLLSNDGSDDKILLFTTSENIKSLCQSSTVFCDGTFYIAPSIFDQIYTIHGMVSGKTFPFVYALLPNRQQSTYERMLRLIQAAAGRERFQFNPTYIQVDFEKAFHNAVSVILPDANLKGCFFHFTQCIWRNCQKHGLQSSYKNNPEIQKLVRRAAVLPLVPLLDLEDVWVNAISESPLSEQCTKFMDYVTEFWIEGAWEKDVWNHHHTDGARTNNNVEGWHHRINSIAGKSHPNLLEFIIKREQSVTETKLSQLELGARFAPKRRKYRKVDERLALLKGRLAGGDISPIESADKASFLLHIGDN